MNTARHHLQPRAIVSRTVQPFGVQIQTTTQVAPVSDISPSETGAFVIPFLPFEITPIGLAGLLDGHQQTRRKLGNVRQSSGEIRNERR